MNQTHYQRTLLEALHNYFTTTSESCRALFLGPISAGTPAMAAPVHVAALPHALALDPT